MERLVLVCIFFLLVIAMPGGNGQNQDSWAKRVDTGKEVVTTMQFYFHDILSGSNPSAIQVAQPSGNRNFGTGFGTVMMADDALTVGPDPTSKVVGRARGLYGSAGQSDMGLIMAMSYTFTDGDYAGSSFSLLSINQAMNPVREMAVVGGTGLFRLARGYAIAKTVTLDPSTGDAVVGYNVTLSTYI